MVTRKERGKETYEGLPFGNCLTEVAKNKRRTGESEICVLAKGEGLEIGDVSETFAE